MGWIRKTPFSRDEDAAAHMISILGREAESQGQPLTQQEVKLLRKEFEPMKQLPGEFAQRTKKLIRGVLERERGSGEHANPRSFSSSLEWAGDQEYPYIVQLTEEVSREIAPPIPLTGWARVKDKIQLVACGIALVLVMFVVVAILRLLGFLK